ncbi:hypothetical protein EBS80_03750 [bacterium]|nr:hypothetical protein [bacterium]
MRRIRIVFALLVVLACAFPFAPKASASGNACFCNISGAGATLTAGPADGPTCATTCAANSKSQGYLWATDSAQYPGSLLQCYASKSLCEKDYDGDGAPDGTYDSTQPAECLPGSHYCYPDTKIPYTLQISIPNTDGTNTTTINNFGDYIGVMYNFLLGFSITIAIVFVMIGGIRYVIGASTGEIGKAKDMIVKAVSGFVLLLFAYVILFTVNPNLLKLTPPSLPMLRRVTILEGATTCDALLDAGYTVDKASLVKGRYQGYTCGATVDVLTDDSGVAVPDGTTCQFSGCFGTLVEPGGDAKIAQCLGNGKNAVCVSCGQVVPGNDFNVPPDPSVCSILDPAETFVNLVDENPDVDVYSQCGYTHSPTLVSTATGTTAAVAAAAVTGGAALQWYTADVALDAATGTCGYLSFSCDNISTCESYDLQKVFNAIATNGQELRDLNYPSFGDPNGISVCTMDPCGAGKKSGKTCVFEEGTVTNSCVGK